MTDDLILAACVAGCKLCRRTDRCDLCDTNKVPMLDSSTGLYKIECHTKGMLNVPWRSFTIHY